MNNIKSLTLSISEINGLLDITDIPAAAAAIDAIGKAVADPDAIDPDDAGSYPQVVCSIILKIKARAEALKKQAETRARRKAERKAAKEEAEKAAEAKTEAVSAEPQSESARQLHDAAEAAVSRLASDSRDLVDLSVLRRPANITPDDSTAPFIYWHRTNLFPVCFNIKETFRRLASVVPDGNAIFDTVNRVFDAISVYLGSFFTPYAEHYKW